ncbi:hypothetical protein TanjilG_32693 [Lupinus angustifolius]|uniref:Uncharacterized protein n=1 Tax=Lupinus angustifolius TaxID=3871 RepID=A0A1J7I1B1_LUPAN|nr:hypothetical protein TanjilG_32693 [Lupinus angustifolius]
MNSSSSLDILDLSYNLLTSAIFHWIFNFTTNLHSLDLDGNLLEGPIPNGFGTEMSSIEVLSLSLNKLQGEVPASLGNICTLRELYLSGNNLSGELSRIVQSFSRCNRHIFQILDLSYNQIAGALPDLSILSSLRELDLSNNQLIGEMPKGIGLMYELEALYIDGNSLEGDITEWHLNNLSNLKVLDLSDNSLSLKFGTTWVPPFQIQRLGLASCKLGPSFPRWLQTQRYLSFIDISDAGINDTVPVWFWNKIQSISEMNMSCNNLIGKIPIELGQLFGLVSLNLSRNNLSGEIPSDIGNLNSLEFLDLSRNHLSGRIPSSLSQIDTLGVLDLSHNSLSGKIPLGTQLQTFGPSSFEANLDLCGKPLEKICPGNETPIKPQGAAANDIDEESVFYGAFYMSIGIGIFTGFWGLIGSILLWKPWKNAYLKFLDKLTVKIVGCLR